MKPAFFNLSSLVIIGLNVFGSGWYLFLALVQGNFTWIYVYALIGWLTALCWFLAYANKPK